MTGEILKRLEPSKEERQEIGAVAGRVLGHLKSLGYEAEVVGSVAKNTWVAGQGDVDVFVFFDPKVKRGVLEKEALKLGQETFRALGGTHEIGYAEHPYVRGRLGKIKVDIVPCYKLRKADIKSAVDRTPFHTKYVRSKLTAELRRHVLLLKQFMKAHEIYGAEAKVQGFSGYLCELLILRYGGFEKVLRASSKWPEVIDLGSYYQPTQYQILKESFKAPLIVIDPVDKTRNVAAVLTEGNLERFKRAAKAYLKKPALEHFFPKPPKPLPLAKAKAGLRNCILVVTERPKVVDDILWPQMRRSAEMLKTQLELNEFDVKRTEVWADGKCVLIFWLEKTSLPKTRAHTGPPVGLKEHAEKFRKKHPGAKVRKGRLCVTLKREFCEADKFVAYLLKKKFLASRLVGMKSTVLEQEALPKLYKDEFAVWLTKVLKGL